MALRDEIISLAPYAFYPLDDSDDVALDASGNNRNGSYVNFVQADHDARFIKEGLPPAPTFSPVRDSHVITGVSGTFGTGTAIIVARPQALVGGGDLLSHKQLFAGTHQSFPLGIIASDLDEGQQFSLQLSSGDDFQIDVAVNVTVADKDQLYLVIAHWSPTESYIEVAGLPRATGAGCVLSSYAETWRIGRPASENGGGVAASRFSGQIGYVAIFDKKLTDTQVLDIQSAYNNSASTQASTVSGTVRLANAPVQRTVRAFGYNSAFHNVDSATVNISKSLGQSISNPTSGEYTIDLLNGYGDDVFVVAFDDYGVAFRPDLSVAVDDRVHPTTPDGFVQECTAAGTLPSTEPSWSNDTTTAQTYGTASMIARTFYRPVVQGPITPQTTGTVLWTPEEISPSFWLDFSDTTSLTLDTNGNIEQVTDKTGNGNNLVQTTLNARPSLRTSANNKTLADSVNGTRSMVSTVNQTGPGPFSISVAVEVDATLGTGGYEMLYQIGGFFNHSLARYVRSDRQYLVGYLDGNGSVGTGGNGTFPNEGFPLFVLTITVDLTGDRSLFINGELKATQSNTITNGAVDGIFTLFDGSGLSSANPFPGAVGEWIMEQEALTEDARQIREGYLAHAWGIAELLPTLHPYKTDPPYVVEPTDDFFDQVSLLLHMDGALGSTNFTDSSPVGLTINTSGSVQISADQTLFGESALFAGGSDRIIANYSPELDLPGDFTIECWVFIDSYPAAGTNYTLVDKGNVFNESYPSYNFLIKTDGTLLAQLGQVGPTVNRTLLNTGTLTVPLSQFNHIALVRNDNTLTLYLNGDVVESAIVSVEPTFNNSNLSLGGYSGTNDATLNGYLDEVRITKGVARYISSFTPPTKPFPNSATIWSPELLFNNNEQGAWYDPSDLSTMFQDSAGTIPVTSFDDPVGLILDKSGNGIHLTQTTDSARPVYRTDGTNSWMETNGTQTMTASGSASLLNFCHDGTGATMIAAWQPGVAPAPNTIYSLWGTGGATATKTGFWMGYDDRDSQGWNDIARLIIGRSVNQEPVIDVKGAAGTMLANIPCVFAVRTASTQTPQIQAYNGNTIVFDPNYEQTPATGNATHDLELFGAGASNALAVGRFYGGVLVSKNATDIELDNVRSYLAGKSGVTL